jgi:hypothetical protein
MTTVHEKFAIVYWGGTRAETMRMWSFHITRNRPNACAFDESKDTALNLASEHLRVLVDTFQGRIPLQDGMLIAYKGSVVYLEYTPDFGMKEVVPITFPFRGPKPVVGVYFCLKSPCLSFDSPVLVLLAEPCHSAWQNGR